MAAHLPKTFSSIPRPIHQLQSLAMPHLHRQLMDIALKLALQHMVAREVSIQASAQLQASVGAWANKEV